MKNTTIYIVIGVVLLAIAMIVTTFEIKEVPDVSWSRNYLPESKDPYGTWMFKSLLKERYGASNVLDRYEEIEIDTLNSTEKHLLVMIGKDLDLDYSETISLSQFSNEGHDILIIGERVSFDYDWGLGEYRTTTSWDSSLVVSYPKITDTEYAVRFRTESLEKANFQRYQYHIEPDVLDQVEMAMADEAAEVKAYDEEHQTSEDEYDAYNDEDDYVSEEILDRGYGIGFTADSLIIFKQWDFEPEMVQMHTLPYLFSNIAAESPEFLDHFNKVIGHRAYDLIIFEHPSFNRAKGKDSKSPLQFILGNRSLKWAYYSLILGALLYVIFKGKRKQRIVPTLKPNKNTSLEYVRTLGSLYEHQDKPRKLVTHLKEIFFHQIKARYYLDISDPAFSEKLSKKSTIEIDEINLIVKTFETIGTRYDFTDVDLSELYRRLDAFYKNCK